MSIGCRKWHDALLEAALTGIPASILREHLSECSRCTEEWIALRAKQERLDSLLPLLVQDAEPSPEFRAQVVAAASEKHQKDRRRLWQFAAAAAVLVAALGIGIGQRERARTNISANDHAAAQKLAEWRAPTDVLLVAPAPEMLEATPRLGEWYFQVPANKDWEE
jgi:predicted anti-sigma-YlaC factor YlaD